MPALVAVRHNRQIREAYGRICLKHPNEKKIGITAAMRRLLLLIYTLWKNGETYDEARDKTHTPMKKEPEPEYGLEDCIGTAQEPVDWNAVDGSSRQPF